MPRYPVHYRVPRPKSFSRLQLLVRIIAFLALGVLGISFGTAFLFGYLALPAYAASRLATDPEDYLRRDAPVLLRILHWYGAICAWAALLCEKLPSRDPELSVHFDVEAMPRPRAGSALWRVLAGLPSALILSLLCWLGVFVWMWAALSVLLWRRVGPRTFAYLEGVQRWSLRLLVYQASLVDEYPPFSFADSESNMARARAISP